MVANTIQPPSAKLVEFCRRHHVRKLSLFGSILRDALRPDSDIDVLVEFDPARTPDFFMLDDMSRELSEIFGGRTIDLVTRGALSPFIQDRVLAEAQVQYEG